MNIPKDYIEFLHWVKETTEAFWTKSTIPSHWKNGAKWIGLEEEEINAIENRYQLKFTTHHRAFLKILHTIDRQELVRYYDENGDSYYKKRSFFYNWKTDDEALAYRLNFPYESILDDILRVNKVWLESWGKVRPKSDNEKKRIFSAWFRQAPRLIPIFGHRFVVSEPSDKNNPILSVSGSDIIVYGWNMHHYLLHELQEDLGLMDYEYDEEYGYWDAEPKQELQEIYNYEYGNAKNKTIPVWEEMILYWSTGWSNFGRKYPGYSDDGPHPIVNTFVAEDEE